jgi:hypothetical protein
MTSKEDPKELLKILLADTIEWDDAGFCPSCHGGELNGHYEGCHLFRTLTRVRNYLKEE